MTPEVITATIDALVTKLAIPADKLFEILPRLGVGDMYMTLVFGGLTLLCLLIGGVCAWIYADKAFLFIGMGFAFIPLLITLSFAKDAYLWVTDPEAWALDYILSMFKSVQQ